MFFFNKVTSSDLFIDCKLEILMMILMHLGCRMPIEVIGVLKPFLAFTSSFQPCAIHNMLVFMLDM
jgi:hypothetical protein